MDPDRHRASPRLAAATIVLAVAVAQLAAQPAARRPVPPAVSRTVEWRSLGPATMSGRFVDLAVHPGDPSVVYAANSTGGLFKTTNRGTTWQALFQHEGTTSIGAIAIAPSAPDTVWVGTGEANNRNSSGWGKGVFRSGDGGRTWSARGLGDTHHIGAIVVHPSDPDVVYVAALGHLWGNNAERGVFKTTDGGRSWEKVLFVDERTGAVHLVMDPTSPETLFAATYERRRSTFRFVSGGPGSGIHRTRDGGRTWSRLTDPARANGLPPGPLGRIGLAIAASQPRVVMAVVESHDGGARPVHEDRSPSGGVFRSEDGGDTWTRVNDLAPRPMYYSKIEIDPGDDNRVWVLGAYLHRSSDGGRTFDMDVTDRASRRVHGDHHALWIDPGDPRHLWLASDGGLYTSYDGASTWDYHATIAAGQFYQVAYDYRVPYRLCGGLQDNGTWCGPSDAWKMWGLTNADWYWVHGADGFHVQVDPAHPWRLYVESQYGDLHRLDLRDWRKVPIQPRSVEGGPAGGVAFCWDWNTPIALSRHDPSVVYVGAQFLFRLTDHGDRWAIASPDLTRGDAANRTGEACMALRRIAESPLDPLTLWTGSNDGVVSVTRDGGLTWSDVTASLPGGSARWAGYQISGLEASRHDANRAYVALDGHWTQDYAPHVFATEDGGRRWRALAEGLPANGSVYVVREDPRNPDLLFAGTEFGAFVSIDRGVSWTTIGRGLPDVAVYDLQIHDRDRDLIAATHGRSLWVADIGPLQEFTPSVAASPAHLFEVEPAWLRETPRVHDIMGHRLFNVPPQPMGATIAYWLREDQGADVRLTIRDSAGSVVRTLTGRGYAGAHRVSWNLRRDIMRPRALDDPPAGPDLLVVEPGTFSVSLRASGVDLTQPVVVGRLTPEQAGDPWFVWRPSAPAAPSRQ